MEKKKNSLFASSMLLLTAIIWGFAFTAQSVGCDKVGCFTFNGIRNIIGGLVLIPVILILKKRGVIEKAVTPAAIKAGICCGVCLIVASAFQQFGLAESTVGKASFITALYVIFVPIFSIVLKKKVSRRVWISVPIAVAGLYLLCMKEGFSLSKGDMLLLIGAFCFTMHILVIDHFTSAANGVVISCIQFFTAGVLSLIVMPFRESASVGDIFDAWLPILYAGCLSSGVAYTLQVVFQKDVEPSAASLILCLESVFGAIGGWLLLGQTLSIREMCGCGLMFFAIVLAQL